MNNFELESIIDNLLNSKKIKDYAPNGLQVQGKDQVLKIVTGVTASQELIDYAISVNADAIIVHHGYLWKNLDPRIRGYYYQRIKKLIKHDLNLYAYHLPLDYHSELGNNVQLALDLELQQVGYPYEGCDIIVGVYNPPRLASEVKALIEAKLNRPVLHLDRNCNEYINKVGICTGGGQGFQDLAYSLGCDAFISGEVSEQNYHSTVEQGIHFFACGHHATERHGIKALGNYLIKHYNLDVEFKDCYNPV